MSCPSAARGTGTSREFDEPPKARPPTEPGSQDKNPCAPSWIAFAASSADSGGPNTKISASARDVISALTVSNSKSD